MRSHRRSRHAADPARGDGTDPSEAKVDGDDLAQLDGNEAKAFFRRNTSQVLRRMRDPSDAANNIAAELVAMYALDPRLRSEARQAIAAAQAVREAKAALATALEGYSETPSTAAGLRHLPPLDDEP
jgi:hypothetical protein